ncbi:MAG: recombinase family protein [Gemmatimonadota bacterium]
MPRRPEPNPTIAVGYVRASTSEQRLTPEAQRAALERFSAARGFTLAAVHFDLGVSGGAPLDRRPGLVAAIDALGEHGAGILLVAKRDRLARDVVLAAMVERLAERKGARVLTADGVGEGEGPEGQLMRRIVDAFGEYERAVIRARTRAALAHKRARGERTGGKVRYGERVAADGLRLEPHPEEARAVERALALRSEGLSIRAVAARLNAEGVPARGSKWHPTTVARLLRRAEAA